MRFTYPYIKFSLQYIYMLTWQSGSVRALDANSRFHLGQYDFSFITFLDLFFSCHCLFSNYYYITEFHNNLKYSAGFKLFSVSECIHSSTENVFHIYQEHRKSFSEKIIRFEGCAFNKIQLHRPFTVFE